MADPINKLLRNLKRNEDEKVRREACQEIIALISDSIDEFCAARRGRLKSIPLYDADDLAQDTRMRLLRALLKGIVHVRHRPSLIRYARTISDNILKDKARAARSARRGGHAIRANTELDDLEIPTRSPDDQAILNEQLEIMKRFIDTLPMHDQELLEMRARGATLREIAEEFNFREPYVAFRKLDRLYRSLAEMLERHSVSPL